MDGPFNDPVHTLLAFTRSWTETAHKKGFDHERIPTKDNIAQVSLRSGAVTMFHANSLQLKACDQSLRSGLVYSAKTAIRQGGLYGLSNLDPGRLRTAIMDLLDQDRFN